MILKLTCRQITRELRGPQRNFYGIRIPNQVCSPLDLTGTLPLKVRTTFRVLEQRWRFFYIFKKKKKWRREHFWMLNRGFSNPKFKLFLLNFTSGMYPLDVIFYEMLSPCIKIILESEKKIAFSHYIFYCCILLLLLLVLLYVRRSNYVRLRLRLSQSTKIHRQKSHCVSSSVQCFNMITQNLNYTSPQGTARLQKIYYFQIYDLMLSSSLLSG